MSTFVKAIDFSKARQINTHALQFPLVEFFQGSLVARRKRALVTGAAFGYSQGIVYWAFALLFHVGAVLVDDGKVEYRDFFTAMFAVIFGAFGVGQVRYTISHDTANQHDHDIGSSKYTG